MTTKEIQDAIDHIKAIAGDDEAAHSEEDALYGQFVKYIADGGLDGIQKKARLILTTSDIRFARWCA